jgi:hypothetical protein
MPPAIDENGTADIWLPARLDPSSPPTGSFSWPVRARLKPGVTTGMADAELAGLFTRLLEGIQGADYRAFLTQGRYRINTRVILEDAIGDVRQPLWILLGTVGFILLIACANVANLFLVRADARQREVSLRAALGAPRGALVRAQLIEAGVLAAIGGGFGVLVAALAVPALLRAAPAHPRLSAVGSTGRSAGGSCRTVTRCYSESCRDSPHAGPHSGTPASRSQFDRGRDPPPGPPPARDPADGLTLVLLVGSGLLIRSFSRMLDTDLGFTPANVLTLRVALPRSSYPDVPRVLDFERRLLERLAVLPGVESAGAGSSLPTAGAAPGTAFVIDGRATPPGELPPLIHYKFVSPGYLETMGMRLIQGRTFDQRDLTQGSRDILVNKKVADAFWPGVSPVGKRLRPSGDTSGAWYTVAGVVASELQDGLRRDPPMLLYWGLGSPYPDGVRSLSYVIRGQNVSNNANLVREAVWALDRRLPVAAVQTMDEVVAQSIVPFTFTMLALGLAAAMALVLGMIGLYGVLSYTVTLRVREIGVRLALGAAPARVMRAVVGQGLVIVGIGLAVGLGGAVGLTRLLTDLLYGTQPLDVTTFITMSAALLAVATLASYLPARRAASVSPLESLRLE